MIKIDRTRAIAPATLASQDATRLAALEQQARAGTLSNGSFDSAIYSSEAVRTALWEMQYYKCCFCERCSEMRWWTVEHFRPKTAVDRGSGKVVGYWWLAYEFLNLYFCCPACNKAKSIHFPLEPGSAVLAYPELPWPECRERSLLVDPGHDDPADHLTFVELLGGEWQIAPLNGSASGRETIRKIGLDRDDLSKLRRKHFKKFIGPVLDDFQQALGEANALAIEQVQQRAKALAEPDAEYSLLARVIFRTKGIL